MVMVYTVMAFIVMAYMMMAYSVMAYIVMVYTVMAYIVMAYTVTRPSRRILLWALVLTRMGQIRVDRFGSATRASKKKPLPAKLLPLRRGKEFNGDWRCRSTPAPYSYGRKSYGLNSYGLNSYGVVRPRPHIVMAHAVMA